MSTIGEQIKELRNKHHLTQSELGEKLHISHSTIANWESNQNYPDIQTKKITVLYVLATMLLSVILLFLLPRIINKDITDDSMIASAKIENNILIVETDLPFYRSYSGYMMGSSTTNNAVELVISTTLDLSKDENKIIEIPLEHEWLKEITTIELTSSTFGYRKIYSTVERDTVDSNNP